MRKQIKFFILENEDKTHELEERLEGRDNRNCNNSIKIERKTGHNLR